MSKSMLYMTILMLCCPWLLACSHSGIKQENTHSNPDPAGKPDIPEQDPAAIKAIETVCVNYVAGWYQSDAAAMATALHPELVKRWVKEGKELVPITREKLLEYAANKREPAKNGVHVEVLNVRGNLASALVVSDFIDYVHLGKLDNRWWVINVLWGYPKE